MFRTIEVIDKLVYLRSALYDRGENLSLIETETIALLESVSPRDKARLEYHRKQIDTANALALDVLAGIARNRGSQRSARTLAEQAESLYRVLGRRYDVERMMISAVTAAIQAGDVDGARRSLTRNEDYLSRSPSQTIRNEVIARHADILLALGRASESVSAHRTSKIIDASRRTERPSLTAGRLFLLAGAEIEAGNLEQAEAALLEGEELLGQDKNGYFEVQHRLTMASFGFASGDSNGGKEALEAAVRLATQSGMSLPQVQRAMERFNLPDETS